MIIKSIITKSTTSEKMVEIIKKSTKRETKLERESMTFFAMNNLEGMGEKCGHEVKINL